MSKPSGSTNAELTDRTRRALLDATLECLVDLGYSRTTTTEIARRAGVSRGAQVHHFPTKAALVEASVDHLFTTQTEAFRAEFTALPPERRTFEKATELLWNYFSHETFRAGLELIVAGGSDANLAAVVNAAVRDFQDSVARVAAEIFPETATNPLGASGVTFAFSVLLGASVYRQVGLDAEAAESIGMLRVLAQLVMPGMAAFPGIPGAPAPLAPTTPEQPAP
jgi:AcrR family transcriptional regulator